MLVLFGVFAGKTIRLPHSRLWLKKGELNHEDKNSFLETHRRSRARRPGFGKQYLSRKYL